MKLSRIKVFIAVSLLSVMIFTGCTEDIAPGYFPPELPDADMPEVQWSGAFDGPYGQRPRFSQHPDSTIIYLTTYANEGIYVQTTNDYANTWQGKSLILKSASAKEPHILALDNGEALIAYSKSYMGVKSIGLLKGEDYSQKWSVKRDIATSANNLEMKQPFLLLVGQDIYCYYSEQVSEELHLTHLMLTISSDKGESWSAPQKVLDESVLGADGYAENISIVKNDNDEYVMVFDGKDMMYFSSRSVLTSKSDDGITWSDPTTAYAFPGLSSDSYGAGDCFVAKLKDGRLIATFQFSDGGGKFGYVMSYDNGTTWTPVSEMFPGRVANGTTSFVADNKYLFVGYSGSKFNLAPMDPNAVRKLPFYIIPRHSSTISIDANWPWEGEGGFEGAQDNDIHMWDNEIRDGVMGGQSWKTFNLINHKDGYFLLQPISGIPTNKVVTLIGPDGDGLWAGTPDNIALRDNEGSDSQLWTVELIDGGFYKIINKSREYVITVENGATNNDAHVIGAPYDDKEYQQWQALSMNPNYKPFEYFLQENEDNGWGK